MSTIDGDIPSTRQRTPALPSTNANASPVDVGDIYKAVAARVWLLPPCLALTLGLAGAYIWVTPAKYTATMSMLVDTRERPPVGTEAQTVPQNADSALVESQMRLISSNEVLKRVVENERLQFDPEYLRPTTQSMVGKIKTLLFGAQEDTEPLADKIVDMLAKNITTKRSEKSYVIDVDVKASSRERAMRLARAIANAYSEIQSRFIDDVANKESDWINRKVVDLRARVEDAERRVEEYRREKALQSSDGHLLPEQQLKDANTALVEARGKRAELESKYQQLTAALRGGGSIESLNETIHSPLIEKLRGDYAALARDEAYIESTLGPRHPSFQTTKAQIAALKKQINAEMQRISVAQQRELRAARNAEKASEQLVADLEYSIGKLGAPKLELNELERLAAALRDRYEKALSARENVRRDVVSSPNGVLIDQPYAEKARTSPKTLPALLIALAAGLNLWVASALIAEYLKRSREKKSPGARTAIEEVKTATIESQPGPVRAQKTPFIADLPEPVDVPNASNPYQKNSSWTLGDRVVQAMQRPDGAFRLAIDEIYDAVQHALPAGKATQVMAIASTDDDRNVSAIALALAHAGHARGDKILLIDADPEPSDLALLIETLQPTHVITESRTPFYAYAQSDDDIGEILMSDMHRRRANWPQHACAADLFDIVIVHCGVLPQRGALVAPTTEIDALLLVERDTKDWSFLAHILHELELDDRCYGIICPPERKLWRRTAR